MSLFTFGTGPGRTTTPDQAQPEPAAEEPPPPAETLTLEEAARRYNFSLSRLRRRLTAGGVPGAYTVQTDEGQEWRIPESSLVALGYRPVGEEQEEVAEAEAVEEVEEVEEVEVEEVLEDATAVDAPADAEAPRPFDQDVPGAAERERRALEAVYEMLEGERERTEAERGRLEEERRQLDADRQQLRADQKELERRRRELEKQATELASERERLQKMRQQHEAERRRLKEERGGEDSLAGRWWKRLEAWRPEAGSAAGERVTLEAVLQEVRALRESLAAERKATTEPSAEPEAAPSTATKAARSTKKASRTRPPRGGEAEAAAATPAAPETVSAWVEPEDGACPKTHPVKGKLSSGVFYLPRMVGYARTQPERCYRDEEAAVADGLQRARPRP